MKILYLVIFAILPFVFAEEIAEDIIDVETFLRRQLRTLGQPSTFKEVKFEKEKCEEEKLVTVYMSCKGCKVQKLFVYDFENLLMKGEKFCPKEMAEKGTRKVGFYSVGGERKLCFKQNPEVPANEFAVYELYRRLYGSSSEIPLPASQVIVMNGSVFLVSEFMQGEGLDEVFKGVKRNSKLGKDLSFDLSKFHSLAVFSMLINPEDCRPQNCLLRKNADGLSELVLIDHDRSFCKEIVEGGEGEIKTRVHCAVFCFRTLMQEKLEKDPFVKNYKVAIDNWYFSCCMYSDYLRNLGQFVIGEGADLSLGVEEYFVKQIKAKVKVIKEESRKKQTVESIFSKLMPDLARVYKKYQPENKDSDLLGAAKCNFDVDRGRSSDKTPPSASVPLSDFKVDPDLIAENGSVKGEISYVTNRKKKFYVNGYTRRDGVSVKGHWRS